MLTPNDAASWNQPLKQKCPHCGNPKAMLQPAVGDYDEYRCQKCGTYRISGIELKMIADGRFDPTLGQLINVNGTVFLTEAGVPMR